MSMLRAKNCGVDHTNTNKDWVNVWLAATITKHFSAFETTAIVEHARIFDVVKFEVCAMRDFVFAIA